MMSLLARVVASIARFRRDVDGSIAPVIALSLIPIITAVGAAVDYSRANKFKASM